LEREITLRDYGRVLWSGRWLILGTTVAAAVVGLLISVANPTHYTARAKVFLGQATTVGGSIAQTPFTAAVTATDVLKGDDVLQAVADDIGVSKGRVRHDVTLKIPRPPGNLGGNQPSVLEITFTDRSRRVAEDGMAAYAQAVYGKVGRSYGQVQGAIENRLDRANRDVSRYQAQVDDLSRQLRSASQADRTILTTLLLQAQALLTTAQSSVDSNSLLLAKTKQIEQPSIVSTSGSVSSSASAPNRLRTVVFAAIIGFIIGVIATFVWKGSPAGRAARA
jgi:uncharacterized protein involved in exopolysaccharide biosynthesis